MKIKYEFLTGETVEIEVSEAMSEVAVAINKNIYNSNHRETRRHNSIEHLQEQGIQLADQSETIVSLLEKQERIAALHKALDRLLPRQRELIQKVFFEEMSVSAIAREEGIDKSAISHRLNRIYQQMKKLLAE